MKKKYFNLDNVYVYFNFYVRVNVDLINIHIFLKTLN